MWQGLAGMPAWYGVAIAGFVVVIAALAAYDARWRRIPNRVVYPLAGAAGTLALLSPTGRWYEFALGGAVGFGLLAVISLAWESGMGMGDAKLAGLIGLVTGWPGILIALFVAFASGALVGVALIALGRMKRSDGLPFAPALLLGTVTVVAFGPPLVAVALPWAVVP